MTTDAVAEAIEHYLRTGDSDPTGAPWPGNLIERSRRAHDESIQSLLEAAPRRNGWKVILARCAPTRSAPGARRTEVAEA